MTADREAKCRSNNAAPIKVALRVWDEFKGEVVGVEKPASPAPTQTAEPKPPAPPAPKSIEQLADEVIAGKHGTGEARRKALGAQFAAVQALVNEKLGAAKPKTVAQLAREVIDGKWGNGQQRTQRLTNAGHNASAVQAEVNRILGASSSAKPAPVRKSVDQIAREVIAGKWGNNPQRSAQESTRWILGDCDFTRYFHYGAEHETVLSVLLSVPRPFDVAYQWTWDTTVFPWVLHLKAATDEISGEARWGKNIVGITKEEDPLPVATRIYPLGYGEGVNQLNIRAVNPTGLPYIQADTVADYGVINYIWVDRRYEDVDSLFSAAKIKLEELKRPLRSYTLDLVELKLLGDYSRYDVGKLVRIHDADIGVVDVRVMKYAKSDVGEQPWAVSLEIGNKRDNLAVSQTDLERRQQINDTYSQGSTNVDSYPYQDNCDAQHPAVIRFYFLFRSFCGRDYVGKRNYYV